MTTTDIVSETSVYSSFNQPRDY